MAPWPGFFSRLGARLPSSSQLSLEGDMLGNPQKYRHINIGKTETKTKHCKDWKTSLSLSLSIVIQRKSGALWRLTYIIIGTCSVGGSHSWGCGPLRAPPKFTFSFYETDDLKVSWNVLGGLSFWDTLMWGIIPYGHMLHVSWPMPSCILTVRDTHGATISDDIGNTSVIGQAPKLFGQTPLTLAVFIKGTTNKLKESEVWEHVLWMYGSFTI